MRLGRGEAGISLIEVLVAVLILSIGVVAGMRGLGQARIGIGGEMPRLLAAQAALNRAEELHLMGAAVARGLPQAVMQGGIAWQLEVDEAATEAGFVEVTVRAHSDGLPGAVFIAYVPVERPR